MEDSKKNPESGSEEPVFQVIDKRKFLDLDNMNESQVEEKPRYPAFVEELIARTAETEKRFEEKKKQIDEEIGRTRARLEAEFERRLALEKQEVILPFLEIMDNLQRAIDAASTNGTIEHLLEGVRMTSDLFLSRLQAIGVEPIEALNKPFDPNSAQAIGRIPVQNEDSDGIVLEELRTGYSMDGQLLRPAQVRVGHHE